MTDFDGGNRIYPAFSAHGTCKISICVELIGQFASAQKNQIALLYYTVTIWEVRSLNVMKSCIDNFWELGAMSQHNFFSIHNLTTSCFPFYNCPKTDI